MPSPVLLQISTNINLQNFQFRPSEGSVAAQFVLLGILGVVVAIILVALTFYLRQRKRLQELALLREEARFKLLMSEANLAARDRELLETFTESEDPGDNIPLLESRTEFEECLERFRAEYPEHEALKKAPALRQKLGYGFANPRYAFDNTRMLTSGIKMRCRVTLPKREVSFVTTVIGVTERQFFIRPPTSKGKPVKLPPMRHVVLRVSRSEDAEYEFQVSMLGQMSNALMAISCAHTTDIHKMFFRNAPRVAVHQETQFYIVRQEVAAERTHTKFKAEESQFALHGAIQDISLGGALVRVQLTANKPETGDMMVFRLPEAQIKEDLVTQVMGLSEQGKFECNVHLQFVGLNELNRLKLNKYIQIAQERAEAAPPVAGDAQPAPSV